MKTNELIASNNEKRVLLTEHNGAYYERLLLYIRTKILLWNYSYHFEVDEKNLVL